MGAWRRIFDTDFHNADESPALWKSVSITLQIVSLDLWLASRRQRGSTNAPKSSTCRKEDYLERTSSMPATIML
jgi:hypothetical protein